MNKATGERGRILAMLLLKNKPIDIVFNISSLSSLTSAEKINITNTLNNFLITDDIDRNKFRDILILCNNNYYRYTYFNVNFESTLIIFNYTLGDGKLYQIRLVVYKNYPEQNMIMSSEANYNIPQISTNIAADINSENKATAPKAVAQYVGNAISSALENFSLPLDAPQDGKVYGRKNGVWEVISNSDITSYKGQYASLEQLYAVLPYGEPGDYVDVLVDTILIRYIWDAQLIEWTPTYSGTYVTESNFELFKDDLKESITTKNVKVTDGIELGIQSGDSHTLGSITHLKDPTADMDAANKRYVLSAIDDKLNNYRQYLWRKFEFTKENFQNTIDNLFVLRIPPLTTEIVVGHDLGSYPRVSSVEENVQGSYFSPVIFHAETSMMSGMVSIYLHKKIDGRLTIERSE